MYYCRSTVFLISNKLYSKFYWHKMKSYVMPKRFKSLPKFWFKVIYYLNGCSRFSGQTFSLITKYYHKNASWDNDDETSEVKVQTSSFPKKSKFIVCFSVEIDISGEIKEVYKLWSSKRSMWRNKQSIISLWNVWQKESINKLTIFRKRFPLFCWPFFVMRYCPTCCTVRLCNQILV